MKLPPIALFTYNRPEKTGQVLRALKSQGVEKVYIFCDGPKDEDRDRSLVQANKDLAAAFPIDHKVIVQSEKNLGLAASLIAGITHAFRFEKELVILEDDCLPFPSMVRFMSENLLHWKENKNIFSISAYHFIRPLDAVDIPHDVFFSNRFLPWGWATWKDRWASVLPELENRENPYGKFQNVPDHAGRDLLYHAYAVEKKMVDSWAIPLGLITLYHGYSHVMPARPLVNNTGMDDTGTNTGSAHNRIIPVTHSPECAFPLAMCPPGSTDTQLEKLFIDSLDVMLPPAWLENKIHKEMGLAAGPGERR